MAGRFSMDAMLGRTPQQGQEQENAPTPREADALAAQIAKDQGSVATQRAEQVTKSLPPGHREYLCPDATCFFRKVGPPGSDAEKAWKSHLERHHHARHPVERRTGAVAV